MNDMMACQQKHMKNEQIIGENGDLKMKQDRILAKIIEFVQIWEWKLCMKEMLIIFHLILHDPWEICTHYQSACQN